MRGRIRGWSLTALLAALALVAGACGTGDGETPGGTGGTEAGGGTEQPQQAGGDIIVGTTDTVKTIDPAKCYDYYCSNIFQNAGETLLSFAPGESTVSPQLAAEMPEISEDGLTYTFQLKDGVTFHDGSEMTAEDVVFSLDRGRLLQHPEGAAFLLAGIESVEATGDLEVTVTLGTPDITFPAKLAYTTATILPSDGPYEAPEEPVTDAAAAEEFINEQEFIGTGPYQLADFREDESIQLEAFEDYHGDEPANDRVLVRFFNEEAQLLAALQAAEIDIAFRHLNPEQRQSLEGSEDIQTIEGEGATIRYLVLNTLLEPMDDVNVRRAIAAAVDRQRIADEVHGGAVDPLYSMVATIFEDAYIPAFQEEYEGAEPSEFIDEPVDIELWYSTDHYGETEPGIAQVLERTLEETELFNVTLQSTEWAQFTEQAWPGETGQYPIFLLGWYPDYLDPDDYLYPFYHSEQSFLQMYANEEMDQLIEQEQTADAVDSPERIETFKEIQRLGATDVPTIPLFQEKPFAFARSNVEGVEETMDVSQTFRYWLISKSG